MWKTKYKFTYTGESQPFHLNAGKYLCICKGASGGANFGEASTPTLPPRGGMSYGILNLQSGLDAYAFVGGDGGNGDYATKGVGGWNGGGTGGSSINSSQYVAGHGGGGASDIRLSTAADKTVTVIHKVPDMYDEVEYIEADGTQYINTDYIHKANTKIDSIWSVYERNTPYEALYGGRQSPTTRVHVMFIRFESSSIPVYGINNAEIRGSGFVYNQKVRVTTDQRYARWYYPYDSENPYGSIDGGRDQIDGNYPMDIFCLNNGGSHLDSANASRCYSFKIYEGDKLVKWFVPFATKGIKQDISSIVWEQGTIDVYGQVMSSTTRVRSVGYIPRNELYTYSNFIAHSTTGEPLDVNYMCYDESYNLIVNLGWQTPGKMETIPSDCKYFRFIIRRHIYPTSDILPEQIASTELKYYETSTFESGLYDLVTERKYLKSTGNILVPGLTVAEKTECSVEQTISVSLNSRIMVAGGGGGCSSMNVNGYNNTTAFGGGVNGGYIVSSTGTNNGKYASQTDGYSFGIGQNAPNRATGGSPGSWGAEGISGGGGGWFGGYALQYTGREDYTNANGGGGSGYILTASSFKPSAYMIDVDRYDTDLYFSDTLMVAGMANESCVIICEETDFYQSGDRILCDCIGQSSSFSMFKGTYTVKCNGGSGAHRWTTHSCRRGGYAQGTFTNPTRQMVYVHVGGSASYSGNKPAAWMQETHPTAGWNGGGNPTGYGGYAHTGTAGGGGTDLRIGSDSLYARIIVAGGAGGCGGDKRYGGAGGGASGNWYDGGSCGDSYGPGTQTGSPTGEFTEICGGFGYGGNGIAKDGGYGGSGGGGWFGGSGTRADYRDDDERGGNGGSGYVLTESSYKPDGYLLDERYYMTDTALTTGAATNLYPFPITGMIIECDQVTTTAYLCHDAEGYKYWDEVNQTWTFLKSEAPTLQDFEDYGTYTFASDEGLTDSYDVLVLDNGNVCNVMETHVIPPKQTVKFRYTTPRALSRYVLDKEVDEDYVTLKTSAKRIGVAEDAHINFKFEFDMSDIPPKETRVYCVQGYTQGATTAYQEPNKHEKTIQHIDLLPIGSGNRMPTRYKNYIGSFIHGTEAISTIQSAVCCEHNRCIYSATLVNDSTVRFAKLNLVTNTSTIIKDIPKASIAANYCYGDIKADDNWIYLTKSDTDGTRALWRTPNSSDPSVYEIDTQSGDAYRIQCAGRMEWYDDHTIAVMLRQGIGFFNTQKGIWTYKMATASTQDSERRDWCLGKYHAISLYARRSNSAYVIDLNTWVWAGMVETYGITLAGSYLNSVCYGNGKFYIVQRNRLHVIDDETFTLDYSIPAPFADYEVKQVVYANGIIYITIQNIPSLFMYNTETQTFYSTGLPFKMSNDWSNMSDCTGWIQAGWIRMVAFRGYTFIPNIKLFTINFENRAKYNLGYKYDQFVAVTNSDSAEDPDNEYEYDDRFVTFTKDCMTVHDGYIVTPLEEIDPTNHIKFANMTKDQYNKFIQLECKFLLDENESEEP